MLNGRLIGSLAIVAGLLCVAGLLAFGIVQETPKGSLTGTAVARESGAPLKAEADLVSTKEVDYAPIASYHTTCNKNGQFAFRGVPTGAYKLEIQSEAHNTKPIRVVIAEGQTQKLTAELQPDEPSLDLYIHQHVFTPGETVQVTCHGFVDSDTVDLRVYRVDLNAFLQRSDRSIEKLLGSQGYLGTNDQSALKLDTNPALKLAGEVQRRITQRDVEGVFTQRVTLPALAPGFYVTAAKSGSLQRVGWVMVTSLGLIAKTAGPRTLAYAVDLKTGEPVAAADVSLYLDNKPVAAAKTGSGGLAYLQAPAGQTGRPDEVVVARSGESFAFLSAEFSSNPSSNRTVYAYTERPVYRPGQFVFYKGIVRDSVNDSYKTPKPQPIVVEVRDPDDTLIYRGTKKTDAFGCYSGAVHLNSEATTGPYSIRTVINGESKDSENAGFSVTAYRKPEFSVKATFDKKRYTRGDWVKAKVVVSYYFGSPVANAEVEYSVRRADYWLFSDDEPDTDGYSDYGGYGESVREGKVRTDANGEATIEFPATWDQPEHSYDFDTDKQFSISLTATDKSGSDATGDASVLVTRGEFALSVEPESHIVAPGSKLSIAVRATDYDKHPVGNQDVTVALNREHWNEDGDYTLETLEQKHVKTDNLGRAVVELPVKKAGSMTVSAQSTDSRGNQVVSNSYVWSTGPNEESWFDPTLEGVDIQLDKKTYQPGDTAKVLILTNRPGATALLTVEGSRIYEARTIRLTGRSTLITIPVKAEYKPNFYISVCGARKKQFQRKEVGAKVSIKSEALNVAITPSKRKYEPGQKAEYTLKTTDSRGKPVSAELSMGVVDEAIYAIEPESTTPIMDFFYAHRDNAVQTYDSFPQIYLSDPDKAGSPLANAPMKIRVRKRFLDTAYWGPTIVTDTSGEAKVSFDLPDNLTTWRATVRGITTDTLCGQSTDTVVARQPMLVRLEMPRFLVQGDKSVLSAIVHNYTGKDQRVKVTLRAPELRVDDSLQRSVLVRNDGSERIDWAVVAGRPGAFAIRVRAEGKTAGDAVQLDLPVKPHGVEMTTATNSVISTGNESQQAVYVRNDAIMEATRLKIRLAPSLASSLLGSLNYLAEYPYGCTEQTVSCFLPDVVLYQTLKSLKGVAGFAKGVSGFERSGNPETPQVAGLESELPDMVHKGFARLYRFQLEDSGWSWSEYGASDPWMTAYVCYALMRAKEAGFPVKQDALDKGLSALQKHVDSPKTYLYPRSFGCYVLAMAGRNVTAELDALAARRYVNNEELVSISLAYQRLGQTDKAKAVLQRFLGNGISSDGSLHWAGDKRYDGGDVEPTALGLEALLQLQPSDPRVYQVVRWLMKSRRDDYWCSTRGTAMAVYALSEFLKTTKELTPNETVTVYLGGKMVGSWHFDKASIYSPEVELTVVAPNLRKGRNGVDVVKSSQGNLYFSTNLRQYIAQNTIPAVVSGAGISVTREYYLPQPEYYQDGRARSPGSPISGCSTGETVLVRLTVHSSAPFQHMLLEDNIPAGCEIVDRGNVERYDWYHWWGGQDIGDDKISFYIDDLRKGTQVVEYQIRAGFAGTYSALPAQVFSMYDPSVRAATSETEFTIR